MTRRTVHLPDDLDKRIRESGSIEESFSAVVQDALHQYLTVEEKADAHAEDLPDGWWDDGLDRYLEWRRAHPEVAEEHDRDDREEIAHEAD